MLVGIVKYTIFSCVLGLFCWTQASIYRAIQMNQSAELAQNIGPKKITMLFNTLVSSTDQNNNASINKQANDIIEVVTKLSQTESLTAIVDEPWYFMFGEETQNLLEQDLQKSKFNTEEQAKIKSLYEEIFNDLKEINRSVSPVNGTFWKQFSQAALLKKIQVIRYPIPSFITPLVQQFSKTLDFSEYAYYWLTKSFFLGKIGLQKREIGEEEGRQSTTDENVQAVLDEFYKTHFNEPMEILIKARQTIEAKRAQEGESIMLEEVEEESETEEQESSSSRDLDNSLLTINEKILNARLVNAIQKNADKDHVIVITSNRNPDAIEALFKKLNYTVVPGKSEGLTAQELYTKYRVPAAKLSWIKAKWYSWRGYKTFSDFMDNAYKIYFKPINIQRFFMPTRWQRYGKAVTAIGMGTAGLVGLGAYLKLKKSKKISFLPQKIHTIAHFLQKKVGKIPFS